MTCLLLLASLGCVESPRYLVNNGCTEKAIDAVARLRQLPPDSPRIAEELRIFQDQAATSQATNQQWFRLEPWKLLFAQAANRSRLLFLVTAQLLSQWSGTNAITSRFFILYMTSMDVNLTLGSLYTEVFLSA